MSSVPAAADRPASRLVARATGSLAALLGVLLLASALVAPGLSLVLLGAGAVAAAGRDRRYALPPVLAAGGVVRAMGDDLVLPLTGRDGAVGAFLLLAAAQLLAPGGRRWPAVGRAAAIAGGVLGLLAIYGLAVRSPAPAGEPVHRALSLATAVGIVAVAAAALPARTARAAPITPAGLARRVPMAAILRHTPAAFSIKGLDGC